MTIRVMIVDDHKVFREGVRTMLEFYPDIRAVAEAGTAGEAVRRACAARPDVALLDVRLPDASGVVACREIRARQPDTAVLMLTAFEDEDPLFASIEAGAAGFLLKHAGTSELVEGIRRVAAGESFLDPSMTNHVLGRLRGADAEDDDRLYRLTATERHILDLVAGGLSNREIAEELSYAESTVKNYVSSILSKLEVARRTQAVAYLTAHQRTAPS